MKVLFVCRANAARSQEAEAFYNALTHSTDATSAGIDLLHSTKGADFSVPEIVVTVMQERGYDLSHNRRKFVTPEMVDAADTVISMVLDYPLPDYLASSPKLVTWTDVPDPVRTPIETHRAVRDLVEKKVTDLVSSILPR